MDWREVEPHVEMAPPDNCLTFNPRAPRMLRALVALWLGLTTSVAWAQEGGFGFEDVIEKARALAERAYQAPPAVPRPLRELSYDEFRSIRFDPGQSLWRDAESLFQVMLIAPGRYFTHAVRLNEVNDGNVQPLPFRKQAFRYEAAGLAEKVPEDLGYAGFTLTYPMHRIDVQDQFLSFAGASYFRGVGTSNAFGISARGAAIDTGLATGEEFPAFVEYWLVRPAAGARRMSFFALLDSRRLTGAYHFTVIPGQPTEVGVEAVVFTRNRIEMLGLAPLTSMYFYGENTAQPAGYWRPEVHDSDGLLIHDGTDERVWRPLINPRGLEVHSFSVMDAHGFGLMQRDRDFRSYEDPEAHYERRPSAWIEVDSALGPGRIVLVQIPTPDETNDNIVAFWSPREPVPARQRMEVRYRLKFGDAGVLAPTTLGQAVNTFVGRGDVIGGGNVENSYRMLVDFAGEGLPVPGDEAQPEAWVETTKGELIESYAHYVDAAGVWRLSVLVRPGAQGAVSVRGGLRRGEELLTETWDYHLPAQNSIRGGGR